MPKFSVIIPTRDRPQFLGAAVSSVLAQTCQDFELLIVNDGSTVIDDFGDRRIHVLDNRQRGAVPARNLGVATAQSPFIAFLDDDDQWIAPDHLDVSEQVLRYTAPFFFADGIMVFPDEQQPRHFAQDADAASLAANNTILISAVCYARNLHNALGSFDEQLPYYWDWDWYLRVAHAGHVLHRRSIPAVNIRIHTQNMSGDSNMAGRQKNLDLLAVKHGIGPLVLKSHADFSV